MDNTSHEENSVGFLPNPYVILALVVAFIGAITASFFEGEHIETLEYKSALVDQQAKVDKIVKDNNDKVTAIETQNANLNAQLEKDHADAQAVIIQQQADNDKLASQLSFAISNSVRVGRSASGSGSTNLVPGSAGITAVSLGGPADADVLNTALNNISNLAAKSDAVLSTLIECRNWAINTVKTLTPPEPEKK
jgi:hypothetical protein